MIEHVLDVLKLILGVCIGSLVGTEIMVWRLKRKKESIGKLVREAIFPPPKEE